MTIAEHLEELGRRKGFREGRLKGRKEGQEEGLKKGQKNEALRIAHEMLRNGLERALVLQLTGLSEAELAQPKH